MQISSYALVITQYLQIIKLTYRDIVYGCLYDANWYLTTKEQSLLLIETFYFDTFDLDQVYDGRVRNKIKGNKAGSCLYNE